jgi:hypothetical protein
MMIFDCVVGAKLTLYANCSEEETLLVAVDSAASPSSNVVRIMKRSIDVSSPVEVAVVVLQLTVVSCRAG